MDLHRTLREIKIPQFAKRIKFLKPSLDDIKDQSRNNISRVERLTDCRIMAGNKAANSYSEIEDINVKLDACIMQTSAA